MSSEWHKNAQPQPKRTYVAFRKATWATKSKGIYTQRIHTLSRPRWIKVEVHLKTLARVSIVCLRKKGVSAKHYDEKLCSIWNPRRTHFKLHSFRYTNTQIRLFGFVPWGSIFACFLTLKMVGLHSDVWATYKCLAVAKIGCIKCVRVSTCVNGTSPNGSYHQQQQQQHII